MLTLLERITADSSDIGLMVELFDTLRPKRPSNATQATANVRTLTQLLKGSPAHAQALHGYARRLLAARRHTSLYTEIGVLSNDGFFTELKRRIAYRILPPALGDEYLSDALDQLLYKKTDYLWIRAVPAADWLALFDVIFTPLPAPQADAGLMLPGLLEAIRTLSYRVCAIGLEPKLTNFHTEMETFESPFMVQNVEVNAYLDGYARLQAGESLNIEDARHLLVMLDQCDSVVVKIRKKALLQGTSIALTYLLVALTQSIDLLRKLLFLIDVSVELPAAPTVGLDAVAAEAGHPDHADHPVGPRRAGPGAGTDRRAQQQIHGGRSAGRQYQPLGPQRHRKRQPHRRALRRRRPPRTGRHVPVVGRRRRGHRLHGAVQDFDVLSARRAAGRSLHVQHELLAGLHVHPPAAFHRRHQAAGDDGLAHRRRPAQQGRPAYRPRQHGRADREGVPHPDRGRARQPVHRHPDRLCDRARLQGHHRPAPGHAGQGHAPVARHRPDRQPGAVLRGHRRRLPVFGRPHFRLLRQPGAVHTLVAAHRPAARTGPADRPAALATPGPVHGKQSRWPDGEFLLRHPARLHGHARLPARPAA